MTHSSWLVHDPMGGMIAPTLASLYLFCLMIIMLKPAVIIDRLKYNSVTI